VHVKARPRRENDARPVIWKASSIFDKNVKCKSCLAHFFPALTLAHRARAAALIRARPAAEMWPLGLAFLVGLFVALFCFFHLALCAAAKLRRSAADRVRPGRDVGPVLYNGVNALMAASMRSRSRWSSLNHCI
jgi:hypothetical protein